MKKLIDLLTTELEIAFEKAGYDKQYARVTLSNRPDLCEFQCNGAMAAVKVYRKAPIMIANDVVAMYNSERLPLEYELHEVEKKDIDNLEDRLKSRFEWGLMADISNADYETRLAILRKKVQLENIIIDDNILSNIAIKVDSNIRELEGTLNKILAKASLTHSPISIELAEQCINEVISRKEKIISADYIQEVVAKYFNISQKDLKKHKIDAKFSNNFHEYPVDFFITFAKNARNERNKPKRNQKSLRF